MTDSARRPSKGQVDQDFFDGAKIFRCKTMQFCVIRRECEMGDYVASATARKPVKASAKTLS
jgi:hypothetical protein